MTEAAYIYDAIRTPRSKGKSSGTLHEVKPIDLVTTLLNEMQSRHDLDTARIDDVMLGCVSPVNEQGAVLPKIALQKADWMKVLQPHNSIVFVLLGWIPSTPQRRK